MNIAYRKTRNVEYGVEQPVYSVGYGVEYNVEYDAESGVVYTVHFTPNAMYKVQ